MIKKQIFCRDIERKQMASYSALVLILSLTYVSLALLFGSVLYCMVVKKTKIPDDTELEQTVACTLESRSESPNSQQVPKNQTDSV